MESRARTRTVGILLYEGFEVLDVFGPAEAFGATRWPGQADDEPRPFDVRFLTLDGEPLRAGNGGNVRVLPDHALLGAPPLDLLLIPGGLTTGTVVADEAFMEAFRATARLTPLVVSVCTGAAVLARAGLLDGLQATTNHEAYAWVTSVTPPWPGLPIGWTKALRWVDQGNIVTSGGVSAGTDMALYLVQRLCGLAVALQTAKGMEYDWGSNPFVQPPTA